MTIRQAVLEALHLFTCATLKMLLMQRSVHQEWKLTDTRFELTIPLQNELIHPRPVSILVAPLPVVIARSDRSDTAVDRLPLTTVDAAVAIRGQGRAKGHMTGTTAVAMTDTDTDTSTFIKRLFTQPLKTSLFKHLSLYISCLA